MHVIGISWRRQPCEPNVGLMDDRGRRKRVVCDGVPDYRQDAMIPDGVNIRQNRYFRCWSGF